MLKAGTPEKIDQEPVGTGPFYLVQYQKDAIIRYKAFPATAARRKSTTSSFASRPTPRCRGSSCRRASAMSCPTRIRLTSTPSARTRGIQVLEQPGLNVGYLAYNVTKKPFDDVRVRKAVNMAINKKAIIDAVYLTAGVAAKNPIPPTSGRTTTRSRTILTIPRRPRSSWPRPAIPTASRPTCGRCRCSARTTPTRAASRN